MQCRVLTVFPSIPVYARAHLCCSLGSEDAPAGRVPLLFPVSDTWEHPTSSIHVCRGCSPILHLIPALCWLDSHSSVFGRGGAVAGLGRCLEFIFCWPLWSTQNISKDLWTTLNLVVLTTCYWIFLPFA